MKSRGLLTEIVGIVAFCCFAVLAFWWTIYRFQDCRKVGHSMLYCILTMGR